MFLRLWPRRIFSKSGRILLTTAKTPPTAWNRQSTTHAHSLPSPPCAVTPGRTSPPDPFVSGRLPGIRITPLFTSLRRPQFRSLRLFMEKGIFAESLRSAREGSPRSTRVRFDSHPHVAAHLVVDSLSACHIPSLHSSPAPQPPRGKNG